MDCVLCCVVSGLCDCVLMFSFTSGFCVFSVLCVASVVRVLYGKCVINIPCCLLCMLFFVCFLWSIMCEISGCVLCVWRGSLYVISVATIGLHFVFEVLYDVCFVCGPLGHM